MQVYAVEVELHFTVVLLLGYLQIVVHLIPVGFDVLAGAASTELPVYNQHFVLASQQQVQSVKIYWIGLHHIELFGADHLVASLQHFLSDDEVYRMRDRI